MYQQTTTQGYSTQQQASQVIYATQQYTTVTTQTFHQQQQGAHNANNAFGLPNDQDSFGDANKDKRNTQQYKAFDWSDASKYESLRSIDTPPPLAPSSTQPTPTMSGGGVGGVNGAPYNNAAMYNNPNAGMFNPGAARGPLMPTTGAPPSMMMGTGVPFFPQTTGVPPSPFTVPNNMHPGAMPFTTPSNLPSPMQPSHGMPVSNPLYAQAFPTQQFSPTAFPAMTQQQLLQQQQFLQQQQQQIQQQQQLHQQTFGQVPFNTLTPQQSQTQLLQQPALQPQSQPQQQALQPPPQKQPQQQQQQSTTSSTPRIAPPSGTLAPPPSSNMSSGVANMVFAPVLASQQAQGIAPQPLQPQVQSQPLQPQVQSQPLQPQQPQQPQPTYQPSSIASSIGSMGSINSTPSPISSLNSLSAPSPIPISPPSPAITARSITPQLQPPPSASHHHNRPSSVTNVPATQTSTRSLSPASVPTPVTPPPVHSSTLTANYSSNVLYSESTSSSLPPQKPDTSDDLFFQQMNRKEEEKNSQTQPTFAPPQVLVQPTPPTPTPGPTTTQPPVIEKENSLGLLAKPPPGRERARSENATKAKQREEQARIARELAASPSPYPSTPSPTASATGSGSAPTTPSGPFYPSTPTTAFSASNPVSPASPAPGSHPSPRISHIPPHISASHPVFPTTPPVTLSPTASLPTPPATVLSSAPHSGSSSANASPHVAPTYPHIPPTAANLLAQESHFNKVGSVDSNIDLMGLEPMTLQEMDERRRAEIEKRVREELEEKHKQEIEKLRKEFESQKHPDTDASAGTATAAGARLAAPAAAPNRARSASHSSALPPPIASAPAVPSGGSQTARGPNTSQRSLPPPPTSTRQHVHSPKQTHVPNPLASSIPPSIASTPNPPPAAAFSLPPPASAAPPSPSLLVDNATHERRAQVKKDLAGIIAKPPARPGHKDAASTLPHAHALHSHSAPNAGAASYSDFNVTFPDTLPPPPEPVAPPAFAPRVAPFAPPRTVADRRSTSFDVDLFNSSKISATSVACPICGEGFQSERILAVHIDDSHGLGSVIGRENSKKHVHFGGNRLSAGGGASVERQPAREPSNASLDALDLSFGSPLGKSRSVDDIRSGPKKDDDLGFGFEAFGRTPSKELPKSKSEVETSKEKERMGTLRHHLGKFGRSRDKENNTPPPVHKGETQQIVDLGEFLGPSPSTPQKVEPVKPEKEGSSFFSSRKGKNNSLSNRTHAPRPSILDTDLMTGSPRPPTIDYGKMADEGSSKMLMPKKMKKKNFVPFTTETAALKIQSTYRMMLVHKEYKKIIFRTKVVKEMVTTEHTYVESIENVLKTFATPLRQMAESGKPLISMDDIAVMFARIEDILIVNRALLEKLTVRVAKWNVVQKIGDVCMDVLSNPINGLDFRKVYNDYTITYNNILETLDRCCKEKSAFKRFIQNGEKMFWGSAGNTIQAFFILPVQRITRYILLFKEVIKYTNPTHPDYKSLVATLHEMECICIDVNENQRKEDTEKKRVQTLVAIQNKVEPRLKELVVDGRYLLREGVISQFDVDDDQIKERYYFLFNDIILVTKKQKQKYLMRLHVTLHNVRLKDIPDSPNFLGHVITNAFEMHTPSKTIMFLAQTVEDKEVVLKELGDVIAHAKEANQNQS